MKNQIPVNSAKGEETRRHRMLLLIQKSIISCMNILLLYNYWLWN